MAQRRVRRKPMAEINVVPYIDVTLVLLIIFMITAPLVQTGVEVDLPQADTETIDQESEPPVIVSIDRQGLYYIDIGGDGEKPVQAETLLVRIKAALKNNPEVQKLLLALSITGLENMNDFEKWDSELGLIKINANFNAPEE